MIKAQARFISGKIKIAYLLIFCWLSALLCPLKIYAQADGEKGLPFIANYAPKTYNAYPQNWSICEDNRGFMYFGNQGYLLEYDGVKWRKIPLPTVITTTAVRSLGKDKAGTIFYGAVSDFGYLSQDSTGQTAITSLRKYIPENKRDFFDIWSLQTTQEGIYYQARERIFRCTRSADGKGWNIKTWEPHTRFMYTFYQDGVYYVHEQGKGLYKMQQDSLVFIPGSEFTGQERVQVMLPYKNPDSLHSTTKQYLIGLFYSGLYLFDGKNFRPFVTQADKIIRDATLYKGVRLTEDKYALSTTGKGLVIINSHGKIIQLLNRDVGLQDESVYAVYSDSKGALWLAMDNGISRIDINSPLTQFSIQSGINTATLSMARLPDSSLFIGTSNGLLKMNKGAAKFEAVAGIPPNQTFSLTTDGNELLVPVDGLFLIHKNKLKVVRSSLSGDLQLQTLCVSQKNPHILYGGSSSGMAMWYRKNIPVKNDETSDWQYLGYLPAVADAVWNFAEEPDGKIWVGTQNGLVYRFTPVFNGEGKPDYQQSKVEKFGTENGLGSFGGPLYKIGKKIFFAADSGFYRFNDAQQRFFKDSTFGTFPEGGGKDEYYMAESVDGRVLVRLGKKLIMAIPKPDGSYQVSATPFRSVTDLTVGAIYPDKDGIVWLCTTDGLIRYDEKIEKNYNQPFKSYIRKLTAGNETLNIAPKEKIAVGFKNNSLRFEYAAPFFEQEEKTQYQTWLEGFEKDWSGFDNNYYKEYTNLPTGDYHFHVRAKNIYQQLSEEAVYTFSINPPWYKTWWAYLLYALVALAILYTIIKWRTHQLHEKHRELEKIVTERTHELKLRAEELSVINNVQEGLVKEMDTNGIYELVGNRICELFDTQTVIIRTFDLDKQQEYWRYAIERGERIYSDPRSLMWANQQLIKSKQPLMINDHYVETAKKYGGAGVSKGLPPKSAMFVPMIVGDAVKGSVSLQNVDKEKAFDDADLRLLTTLSNSMSVALENARLFHETTLLLSETKQRATELATVNNIGKALASQLNAQELIQLVGDQLKDLFRANIVYLALLNKKTKIIEFPYQFGDNMAPMKFGQGLTSRIIKNSEPLLINKDLQELRAQMGVTQIGVPAASYLGVPIPVGDENIGVLSVQSTETENRFNENDLRLLSTIASSVGVALRNATLFEEVKLAKMEAESASKLAEKANEAKSAFLSTVSHELRTPLTSVLGFAKIIKKRLEERIFPIVDKSDAKIEKVINQVSENLHVVISEGERLTHLINDVLDLAKIEAGKMDFNQENVSMPEVAERAIAATTSLFDQKALKLIRKIDTAVPEIIGDKDKLIQVIINLISNSVKFTDEGAITCSVFKENDELIVSITDTGIGIAPEDFGAVFEQFKQVGGDTLTDKPKGTGLGLPICKEIVEHLGGRIWLESERGKGSTFSFALPLVKTSSQRPIHLDDLVRQLKEQVAHSQLHTKGSSNILIVDDDDSIRSLLQQELGDAGYNIDQASNGKEALARVRANRPDLVILDIMMPEMNGFDVAAVLKNDPETMDIPIIVLSVVQDKARGFRIGVDRYLTKPIDTNLLFTEIGSLLDQGKSKKKVMIVDEDSAAVNSLIEVLAAKGYEVMESTEKELMQKATANLPDIIIINSLLSGKQDIVKTLRFEKGLENVLFVVYQ